MWRDKIPRSRNRLGRGTVPWRMWHVSQAGFRLVDDTVTTIITITDIHDVSCQSVLGALCMTFGDSRAPHSSHCWMRVLCNAQDGHQF